MRALAAAALLSLVAATARSATPPAPAAPPAAPAPALCASPEYAQMDFWLGRWDVFRDDAHTGQSLIEKLPGGCGVREVFTGDDDYSGTSLSWYDNTDGRWRQTYINNQGSSSRFEGRRLGREMVLVAYKQNAKGFHFQARMTLSPQDDGSVRRMEEISIDEGRTWKLGYAFLYRRKL